MGLPIRVRVPRWLFAGVCGLALACGGDTSVRPNVVLITVAPLPAARLACYGGPEDAGAEICGLGDTGARYSWAFTPSTDVPTTTASVLTSLYPWQHGVTASPATFLRDRTLTVPERLRRAGYATAGFVGAASLNRSRNLRQGFGVFDDRAQSDPASDGTSLAERALAWAEAAPRPFFLWIHFSLDGPAPDAASPNPETDLRRLDRRLSQLIAVLDADPRPPGILFAGLQGSPPRLQRGKPAGPGHLHPAGVRVPLLWRPARAGPGHSVGRRVTTPVSLVDIGPTLLQAAGLPVTEDLVGRPLPYGDLQHADRPGDGESTAIFIEHPLELAVVIDGEWAALARTDLGAEAAPPGEAQRATSGRTAGLWPQGDRRSERTPTYDSGRTRSDRLARLRPRLEAFAAGSLDHGPEEDPAEQP